MNTVKKPMRRDSGIALLTTLLLMMLMSSLLVGFILLITSGQKLSGINNDYSRAFYAAEFQPSRRRFGVEALLEGRYHRPGGRSLKGRNDCNQRPAGNGLPDQRRHDREIDRA